MKKIKFSMLMIFVSFVVTSCVNDDDSNSNILVGHELALTDWDGTVYKSSEYFFEDEKEILTDNIYYEGGVYWAQARQAEIELEQAFEYVNALLKDDACRYGYSLSFPVFYPSTTRTVLSRGTNSITFSKEDVDAFVSESNALLNECWELISDSVCVQFIDEAASALKDFSDNPTVDDFQKAVGALLNIPFSSLLTKQFANENQTKELNEEKIKEINRKILVLTDKYKEIFIPESTPTVKATIGRDEIGTKWNVGDQISVNGKIYEAQNADTITTFRAVDEVATGDTYTAFSPVFLNENGTPTFPERITETWENGKFKMPMYAKSADKNLEFKNLCGVLKITVQPNLADRMNSRVAGIRISSANCAVSGKFSVVDDKAVLVSPSSTTKKLTITYKRTVNISPMGEVALYVAIPAQTYKGLKIELASMGHEFSKCMMFSQDVNIERNKIYSVIFEDNYIPPIPPPTGSTGSVGSVNWVQLWAGGPKFADRNLGANSPTEMGGNYSFTKTGENDAAAVTWGPEWRVPTKGQMDELFNAASGGSSVVKCRTSTNPNGFIFSGVGSYAGNSVFFPAFCVTNPLVLINESYWSGTEEGEAGYILNLTSISNIFASDWDTDRPGFGNRVRPVLKE